MKYTSQAKFTHRRVRPSSTIIPNTFRTVYASSYHSTRKKYPLHTKLVIGRSRSTNNWVIHSILTPKR